MKIFFCHIPKNAGTSIANHFLDTYKEENVFGISEHTREDFFNYTTNIINKYNFVSGHVPLSLIEEHINSFDLIFCVVRNPINRLISMCDYVTSTDNQYEHLKDNYMEFFRSYYLTNQATRNEQCGYIGFDNTFLRVLNRLKMYPKLVILRHEHLISDFNKLCIQIGLENFNLDELNKSKDYQCRGKFYNSLANNMELYKEIFDWFDGDFLLYDYLCQNHSIFKP